MRYEVEWTEVKTRKVTINAPENDKAILERAKTGELTNIAVADIVNGLASGYTRSEPEVTVTSIVRIDPDGTRTPL